MYDPVKQMPTVGHQTQNMVQKLRFSAVFWPLQLRENSDCPENRWIQSLNSQEQNPGRRFEIQSNSAENQPVKVLPFLAIFENITFSVLAL